MISRSGQSRVVGALLVPLAMLCSCVMSTAFAHALAKRHAPPMTQAARDEAVASRGDPQRYRDPFQSWLHTDTADEDTPELLCPQPQQHAPLAGFDFSVLKMTGILRGDLGQRAIIGAPDGRRYFVAVGSAVGQQCGKVITIEAAHLVIEQQYKQGDNVFSKELTLRLPHTQKKR